MRPISEIHPFHDLRPGRYLLDATGILFLGQNPVARPVAAVVVLAPGQLTRRQLAEQAACAATDDLRATDAAEKIRAECAAEASEREARFREAKRLTVAHPTKVSPQRAERPLRSLARQEKPANRPAPQPAPEVSDEDEDFADFKRRVAAKQAARLKAAAMISEPKIDGKQIAAVHREMKLGPPPKKVPTRRALTDSECHACGTRTTIGCEHFLPFLGDAR